MKRVTTWLLVIFLTFTLGVTATLIYLSFNTSNSQKSETPVNLPVNKENKVAGPSTLSLCELSNKPQEYNGKVVRLSATLLFGTEGSWFSSQDCMVSDGTILVSFENEKAWKPIGDARKQKNNKPWANQLDVIVIGKFKNEDPRNCCIIAPFQFEILQVEKVSKIN